VPARTGLAELIASPPGEFRTAVAGGLARTKDRRSAMLARPLLTSPYRDAALAALALGRFGEPAARAALAELARRPDPRRANDSVLAATYLVRMDANPTTAVAAVTRSIK
jgi:HEAT repeat protein